MHTLVAVIVPGHRVYGIPYHQSIDNVLSLLRIFGEPTRKYFPLTGINTLEKTAVFLTEATDRELTRFGKALVLDCHGFPSRPLLYELDQDPDRPDICLGTDPFHTPDYLVKIARKAVTDEGLTCAINRPFRGTMVPGRYYRRDHRVSSIMIEVNRSLYMDEETGESSATYEKCKALVGRIIGQIRHD